MILRTITLNNNYLLYELRTFFVEIKSTHFLNNNNKINNILQTQISMYDYTVFIVLMILVIGLDVRSVL